MRPMLVRDIDDKDIYINPKQIETIRRDSSSDGYFEKTIITFVSGDDIVIRESIYNFIQDLRKN